MAFADTETAISAVTNLLKEQINIKTNLEVTVARPEPTQLGSSGPRLNLFLYEATFDASLKNFSLDEGQAAPLWLVLRYLITAFDDGGDTDTAKAHGNMGKGLRALQELSILHLTNSIPDNVRKALKDNPEELKITFNEATVDTLSKIMQGSDEKFRFSMAFQVQPVMIAAPDMPSYSLLVGVDYTNNPDKVIGEEGIEINVLPSLGPYIESVSSVQFEVDEEFTISGTDLISEDFKVKLGGKDLNIVKKKSGKLVCKVDTPPPNVDADISAGSHGLQVVGKLPSGNLRKSNLVIEHLLPKLNTVGFTVLQAPDKYGTLTLTGELLGGEKDDIIIALYQDGKILKMYDDLNGTKKQKTLSVVISQKQAPNKGTYRVIFRVNGQQARKSPSVDLP